jgi:hypothetical protein
LSNAPSTSSISSPSGSTNPQTLSYNLQNQFFPSVITFSGLLPSTNYILTITADSNLLWTVQILTTDTNTNTNMNTPVSYPLTIESLTSSSINLTYNDYLASSSTSTSPVQIVCASVASIQSGIPQLMPNNSLGSWSNLTPNTDYVCYVIYGSTVVTNSNLISILASSIVSLSIMFTTPSS